jgi:hypothetical protein
LKGKEEERILLLQGGAIDDSSVATNEVNLHERDELVDETQLVLRLESWEILCSVLDNGSEREEGMGSEKGRRVYPLQSVEEDLRERERERERE